MTISLNWLKEYIDTDLSPEKIGEILTAIGLEVEGMEQVESIKGGLEGVVVGEVLTCGKHPNADKLSVTTVNTGNENPLHIVCGAPNVAAGQKVLVATIGTTLYPSEGDPIKLKKGKIRGQVSEGMICAEDELGIGNDHSGIMVLEDTAVVGMAARDYLNIETDVIYEIGLTPNRSDATNHLGVAKDLAAYLKINHNQPNALKLPSIASFKGGDNSLVVDVEVKNEEACPRYAGVTIKNIKVQESPDWLKNRLRSVGVRPINNIVDITNFILHELGQPLHAFDLEKVTNQKIIVQTLAENAKFTTLDEKERSLSAEDLMICDGKNNGMCIAGVFGGITSGVTDETTSIFLESAHFNAKWIRRTSMRHVLRTDAAKVFEKGSDPNIAVYALKRAALLIKELAGGTIASDVVDLYPNPIQPTTVKVAYQQVNRLIGIEIPKKELTAILEALEMEILEDSETHFTVAVPTNKADVTREADVIEEILRIYGFNKVPMSGHISMALSYTARPNPHETQQTISNTLVGNGFHEMMGLSLSQSNYYKEILWQKEANDLVYINNTSNVHLDIMRPDMLVSGLEAILYNQNRQQQDLRLFEFGRSYRQTDKIEETKHLSLFMTGKRWEESWLTDGKAAATFYTLKGVVNNILDKLGFGRFQTTTFEDESFDYAMRYHRGPQILVEFGQVATTVTKKMDIKNEVFYADFRWDNLLKALKKHKLQVEELNKYPTTRRDLALVIDNSVKFSDIATIAHKEAKKWLKAINLFDVYESETQLGKGKKSYAVSFVFENAERTLKDKEVDKIMTKLIQQYETKLNALIRK